MTVLLWVAGRIVAGFACVNDVRLHGGQVSWGEIGKGGGNPFQITDTDSGWNRRKRGHGLASPRDDELLAAVGRPIEELGEITREINKSTGMIVVLTDGMKTGPRPEGNLGYRERWRPAIAMLESQA